MKRHEIDQLYTTEVAALLGRGFQINTATMSGTQGELAHIDLAGDGEVYRVLLERTYSGSLGCGALLRITVGRCPDVLPGEKTTVWNDGLEVRKSYAFAQIGEDYYTTVEEAQAISEKRMARWQARHTETVRELSDAFKSVALRYLTRQPRMRSCCLEEITWMTRRTRWDGSVSYIISARGRDYTLAATRR